MADADPVAEVAPERQTDARQAFRFGRIAAPEPDVPDEVQDVRAKPGLAEPLAQRHGPVRGVRARCPPSPPRSLALARLYSATIVAKGISIAAASP